MKRIISLVLAVSMVLSVFATAFAARKYTDLTGDDAKYAGAVEALTELGVIDGFTDNTFGPNKELTRAQLAKMLVICLGLGDSVESLTGRTVFSDVAATHWGAGYINAAAQSKVITGYPDGTFKPEKNVSYAEAFTMALRALGYGNVVEAEGTWPTAYMLKAVELELTDDMEGAIVAGNPALRGNTAILLWNMLRTPMWKIYEESEGNGMTLSAKDDFMLNVKFPKYMYAEDVYLSRVDIDDQEVTATVMNETGRTTRSAKLAKDTDISRLVLGMKVTTLIKDYKDAEKATFLTLTPEYDFVEGLATNVENLADGKISVDNEDYKVESKSDIAIPVRENDFVILEVEGKKIVGFQGDAVMKVLPNTGKEVEKPSTLKSKIDEDALVIIDGVWSTRDDIEEGDVYTELGEDNDTVTGDNYYMVARERTEGTFESLTYEKDDDERMYFEVDGEEYRTFYNRIKGNIYEGEDKVKVDVDNLTKKKKDNDYLDQDIELVMNYLNQVVKAYFGDVDGDNTSHFYAVMSNGVRVTTDDEGDETLKIKLANGDDTEGTLVPFKKSFDVKNFEGSDIEKGQVYKNAQGESGEVVFVWAKMNEDEEIKSIAVLRDGLTKDNAKEDCNAFAYDDDYAFVAFEDEAFDKNTNYITANGGDYKITDETVVYILKPVEDEDDDTVTGFEFSVAEDPKAALDGVKGGLVAYDTTSKINKNAQKMTASFVFIKEDAVSSELNVAKVEGVRLSRGIPQAKIDGEWNDLDTESDKSIVKKYDPDVKDLDKAFIVYSTNNKEEVIVRSVLNPEDLAGAQIVEDVEGSIVQFVGDMPDIDVENDKDEVNKRLERFAIVVVTASVDKNDKVEFEEGENVGEGLEDAKGRFSKGDRVVIDPEVGAIYIVSVEGVDEDDEIDENGKVTYIEKDDSDVSGDERI